MMYVEIFDMKVPVDPQRIKKACGNPADLECMKNAMRKEVLREVRSRIDRHLDSATIVFDSGYDGRI